MEGFRESRKEGMISLNDLMRLFSGPYFKKRNEPDYFSRYGEYTIDMMAALDRIENAGSYWRLTRLEKLAFKFGLKLIMK